MIWRNTKDIVFLINNCYDLMEVSDPRQPTGNQRVTHGYPRVTLGIPYGNRYDKSQSARSPRSPQYPLQGGFPSHPSCSRGTFRIAPRKVSSTNITP